MSANRELDNLIFLNSLEHEHIIRLLASYTKDGKNHFLFPLASCNLDEYMDNYRAHFSKDFVVWLLGQFIGLADGIKVIHRKTSVREEFQSSIDLAPGDNAAQQLLNVPKPQLASTGFHHDLKASNILFFESPARFQIIDFGVSKFHVLSEDERTRGTKHPRGTTTYQGPESRVGKKDATGQTVRLDISRPYDVWSFGCIMIEILVWLLLGGADRAAFGDQRFGPVEDGSEVEESDAFWVASRHFETARVRPAVTAILDKLRKSERAQLVPDVCRWIDLAGTMLEVDPQERVTIVDVHERLESILEALKNTPSFGSARPSTPVARNTPEAPSANGSPSKTKQRSANKSVQFSNGTVLPNTIPIIVSQSPA
jgi:serine/threonine protein kinase